MSNDKLYANAAREAAQRDRIVLELRNALLKEQNRKLEQLVKEAILLMDRYTFPGTKDADAWTKRAKALVEQEV